MFKFKKIAALSLLAALSTAAFSQVLTRDFKGKNNKCGIIDQDLNVIIPANYLQAGEFTGKYANVQLSNGKWALIDRNCNQKAVFECKTLYPMHEGWCLIEESNGKFGLVNENGEYLVRGLVHASGFSEGLASVTRGNYSNGEYINPKGETVFKNPAGMGLEFHDGMAIVYNIFESMSVIDKTGKEIIPSEYRNMTYLGEGIFSAEDSNNPKLLVLLDKNGNKIIDMYFKRTTYVKNGIIFVTVPEINPFYSYPLDLKTLKLTKIEKQIDNEEGKYLAAGGKTKSGKVIYTLCDENFNALSEESFTAYMNEVNDIYQFLKDGKIYYVNAKGKVFCSSESKAMLP